ncbi:MAG: HD domain-containing protein, partial [Thermodesulfovibrionales bacterium]|nr:HD domain-containing protein [Thermodesulfovibrionales bacterium]
SLTGTEAGSLLLMDSESGELYFEVALGEKSGFLKKVRIKAGQGIAGWVAEHREPVISSNVTSDQRFFDGVDLVSKFKTRDMLCVPVLMQGRLLGVIQAINKLDGVFSQEDMDVLISLGNLVAIAIDNANMYQEQREMLMSTIETLAEIIEKRDSYTGGHTHRVRKYSLAIGRILGLPHSELNVLDLAAALHDIGKIAIRDGLLLKKGSLTGEEFNEMTKHTVYGVEIIAHIGRFKEIMPHVKSHHERLDGTGYPEKISGDDIPLLARIIAVADAFDAMTTNRPYGERRSKNVALEELNKCAGTQFDGKIVDAFIHAWDNNSFADFEEHHI